MRQTDSVLASALGEKKQEYFSLNEISVIDADFAKKSKYHGKIMSDGYVFNPYVHRRWLPAQYLSMRRYMSDYGYERWDGMINEKYNIDYIKDYTEKETYKLLLLSRSDKYAFEERRQFFTESRIKQIYYQYLVLLKARLQSRRGFYTYWGNTGYLEGYGYCPSDWVDVRTTLIERPYGGTYYEEKVITLIPLIRLIDKLITSLNNADTYYEISKVMEKVPNIRGLKKHVNYAGNRSPEFNEAFKLSGAYYTCKHLIMFDNGSIGGRKGADACQILRSMLNEGASFEDFDSLIDNM